MYADSIAVYEELGLRFRRAVRSLVGAQIEILADDLAAAESELRTGYSMLEEMGERGARSTVAGLLADVVALGGLDDEAERFAEIARTTAADADVMPQVLWRRALARVAVRQGLKSSAETLAREAVALADQTDSHDFRAATLMVLADVLRGSGKAEEASAVNADARRLYELKGNLAVLRALDAARQSVS